MTIEKIILKSFILLVLGFGLSACGGSGGGGSDDEPGDGDGGTDTLSGFDLKLNLSMDDFWEFYWFNDTTSFAQGSGASSTTDFGIFRVTLGASINASGLVAYPLIITGDAGPYLPRWTHVALRSDGTLLGSTDGVNFQIIFDISTREWNGGGFFHDFEDDPVSIEQDTLIGEYNTVVAIELGYGDSSGGCDTILGITLCDDTSTTFSFKEFHKEGIGPVGFRRDTSFSSSGGGFFTSTIIENTVELIETSETATDMTVFNRPDWELMAPMNVARERHAAVVLAGNIHVLGGFGNSGTLTSMEIYNPVLDQWTTHPDSIPTTVSQNVHVVDGKIYAQSANANEVHIFDPNTDNWSSVVVSTSSLPVFGTASDTYFDVTSGFGDIIIGVNQSNVLDNEMEVVGYQPSDNLRLLGTSLPIKEWLSPSITVFGDIMYAIGGFGHRFSCSFSSCDRGSRDWVAMYDLTTDTWDTVTAAEMNIARDGLETIVFDGNILALGGEPKSCSDSSINPTCNFGATMRSAESYDPNANTWTDISSMLTPRSDFASVIVNGDLFVIGGNNGSDEATSVERYRP